MADDVASLVNGRRATEVRPLLHVIAGANQGAEAPLDEGAWIIGTGAGADLTFAEAALADTHVRIVIAGGTCRITALAEGVQLGADMLAVNAERDLPALRPVTVGGTTFAIGPAGTDWSAIEIVAPAPAAPPPPEPEAPAAEAPATPVPEPAADTHVDTEARMPTSAPRRSRLMLALAIAAVVVLVGIGVGILLSARPQPATAVGPDPLTRARGVIQQLHLPDVVAELVKGHVLVAGYTDTNDQIDDLQDGLRRQAIDADVEVRSEAALVDMATTVLKAFGIDATAEPDGPGNILLVGYTENGAKLSDALHRMKTDVAGLRAVIDHIVTMDRARASLEQSIAAAGLTSVVKLTTSPHTIKVVGFLDQSRMARWKPIEDNFRKEFGERISLDTQFVSLTAAAPRGVRLGKDPYILLDNGNRLAIGDMLGTTGKIVGIQADKVRVRTASGDVDLPYTQAPNWIMEDKK